MAFNRANALPTAFKCAADDQWHEPDKFSQNQLAKWHQKKKRVNDGVTPENVGLICKQHSAQPAVHEIQCHGPCSAWKYREHFSKNQRNDPEPWCIVCTAWTSQFGGTEVPLPPPSSKLSSDEIIAQTSMVQDQMPDIPAGLVGGSERRAATVISTSSKYGARIDDGPKGIFMLEGARSMIRGTSSYGDGTADTGSTRQGDKYKGIVDGLSAPSFTGQGRPAGQTTLAQLSADRTTYNSQSGSRGATSSIATSNVYKGGSIGVHAKKSVDTRGQSSAGGSSSVTATNDQATDQGTPRVDTGSSSFAQKSGRWPKVDNRKVFYVPPTYAARPEDFANTDDPEWSSDEN
ncbi:Stc1 domain-containing protein [Hypoxylon cercidicola]|nr:Stc1 domain-containing protein [Hypoxylon cercidicola]